MAKIRITNTKLQAPELDWADFRGFSYLFHHGANHLRLVKSVGRKQLWCRLQGDLKLALYDRLAELLDRLDGSDLCREGFAALRPETFHITACDLIHRENVAQIAPGFQPVVQDYLARLPRSLDQPLSPESPPGAPPRFHQPISFAFDRLAIRNGTALVVFLKPVSKPSALHLERFLEWRTATSASWSDFCALPPAPHFEPHVSLGYFANAEFATKFNGEIKQYHELFAAHTAGHFVEVAEPKVYFFTDMVSFWPAGQESRG